MSFRQEKLTRPIYRWAKTVMPPISETEREAIDAGTVWWDGELFGGNPDWDKLLAMPPSRLSPDEQAFLDGPVEELCGMVDDWKIVWEDHDLPPEVWDFMRRNKFFGMIIPKEYGGLGFSNTAHSEVVRKVSSVSVTRRRHGDGAELARARRADAALRHAGAARLLAAAARRRPRDPVLRPDLAGSGLGRGGDDRHRRRRGRRVRRRAGARHPAELREALHHPRPRRDGDGPRLQDARSGEPPRPGRGSRHHRRADPDEPSRRLDRRPARAAVHLLPERPALRQGRLHPARHDPRRAGADRPGLDDADDGAGRRPRHLAAVAVLGRRGRCAPARPAPMPACAPSSTCRSACSRASSSRSPTSPPTPI